MHFDQKAPCKATMAQHSCSLGGWCWWKCQMPKWDLLSNNHGLVETGYSPKCSCFLYSSPGSFSIEPWNDHNLESKVLSDETLKSSFWIIVFVMTKSLPFFFFNFPFAPKNPMGPQSAKTKPHLSRPNQAMMDPGRIARCRCHETLEVTVLYSDF